MPGDTLTGIADAHGVSEPLVWDLNRGRIEPDGRIFTDPNLIRPGDQILIPTNHPTATTTQRQPAEPTPPRHPPHPPTTAPPTTAPTTTARPTDQAPGTADERPSPTADRPAAHPASSTTSARSSWREVFAGGGGLLAAGVPRRADDPAATPVAHPAVGTGRRRDAAGPGRHREGHPIPWRRGAGRRTVPGPRAAQPGPRHQHRPGRSAARHRRRPHDRRPAHRVPARTASGRPAAMARR